MIIAFDLETCPLPEETLTPQQEGRRAKEYRRQERLERERGSDMTQEEIDRLVRSLHPLLGWICCISVVRYDEHAEQLCAPRSYTAGHEDYEAEMLMSFWADLQKLPGLARWVSFCGKRFDSEMLLCRTLTRGLRTTRSDVLHRHPYQHRPHCDLATAVRAPLTLADLCALLGVESPKGAMQGAGVAEAVAQGRLDEVARYCEGDAVATLQCFLRARHAIL